MINYTRSTASRAANASMSAQETTPGQEASNCVLASSITSNPLNPPFVNAFLSAEPPVIRTEPSQPCSTSLYFSQKEKKINNYSRYLNKAIMEMKPKKASCNSSIFVIVIFHN